MTNRFTRRQAQKITKEGGFDMTRINFYTLKMVKEASALYEVPIIKSPTEVYQAAKQLLALHEKPQEHFCILCRIQKQDSRSTYNINRQFEYFNCSPARGIQGCNAE